MTKNDYADCILSILNVLQIKVNSLVDDEVSSSGDVSSDSGFAVISKRVFISTTSKSDDYIYILLFH